MLEPMRRLLLAAPLVLAACTSSSDPATKGGAALELGSEAIAFPITASGTRTVATLELRNGGGAPLDIVTVRLDEPFRLDGAMPSRIAPGGIATLPIAFVPHEAGSYAQPLTVRTAAGDATVQLTGEAVASALRCGQVTFPPAIAGTGSSAEVVCESRLDRELTVRAGDAEGSGATSFRAAAGSRDIEAFSTFTWPVSFSAGAPGEAVAALPFLDGEDRLLGTAALRAPSVTSFLTVEPPASCDTGGHFLGHVGPGFQRTANFAVENIGPSPLTLGDLAFSNPAFTVEPASLTLGPGEQANLVIAFAPDALGPSEAWLRLTPDAAGVPPVELCFRGNGAGPSLTCSPGSIDLGAMPVGLAATARFTCTAEARLGNEGPLRVVEVYGEHPALRVTHETPSEYAAGSTFTIEATLTPQGAGAVEARLVIETDDLRTPRLPLTVRGGGTPASDCVIPTALAFGLVEPGTVRALALQIGNPGQQPCWIGPAHLPEAGPFAATDLPAGEFLAPGSTRLVPLTFAPTGTAPREADLTFATLQGNRTVRLTGSGNPSCIALEPETSDLGFLRTGCRSAGATTRVHNTCDIVLRIDSVTTGSGGDGQLSAWSRSLLPANLQPGAFLEVGYQFGVASLVGDRAAAVLIEAGGAEGPVVIPVGATATADRAVDLFVVDEGRTDFPLRGVPEDTDADGHLEDGTEIEVRVDGERLPETSGWLWNPSTNEVRFTQADIPPPGSELAIEYRPVCH